MLHGLMERFGGYRVWNVGIEVLGFPPTWNPSTREILLLQETLEKGT